jgi:2-polyprenyl-6-methoxyphenol hydroxylase-like FAD-dependent oxidoreductase
MPDGTVKGGESKMSSTPVEENSSEQPLRGDVGERKGIVIVGAGPVGVTAALLLSRQGLATTVLEASPGWDETASGSKAICQQRDVLDILDRVGVAEPMLKEAVTWTRGRTFYKDKELFTVEFEDPGESPTPPWVNISQCSTERYLLERAKADPMIEILYGHEVVGLSQGADSVRLDLELANGERRTMEARWVLAADGSHSPVRHMLGIGFPGQSFDDQFLIVDVKADLPFPNERHFHFDPPWNPGRQVLIHECPNGVWRIDWQVPADYDLEAEKASGALDERVRRIVGDAPYEIVWLSVYRFHERIAEHFRVGRVFLMGDAAHIVAPFGARGLNSGIQDAENLAWKLALVEKHVVSGEDAERLLSSYEVERRAAALENIAITTDTMNFLVPRDEQQWEHRRQVLEAAVRDPSKVAQVNSGKLAEPYPYHDSPLTTPRGLAETAHGSQGPGSTTNGKLRVGLEPGSLFPDAPCAVACRSEVRRVRDLFGSGFVILAPDGVSLEHARKQVEQAKGSLPGLRIDLYDVSEISAPAKRKTLDQLVKEKGSFMYVIRPDGHVAGVLDPSANGLADVILRACGCFGPEGSLGTESERRQDVLSQAG